MTFSATSSRVAVRRFICEAVAKQQNCASTVGQLAIAADSTAKSAPVKQRRRRTMEFFCGLDVAMDETAVWIVDDHGVVHLETTAVTDCVLDPEALPVRRGR
ncbi:hypothetical protein NKI20_16780 [Mesorhizobium sp. M0830]|uniref:hypothetical protein n=1 Tax=Mesorhizobium sp. M0830 TaxID=2957008 RepID=UPI00333DA830